MTASESRRPRSWLRVILFSVAGIVVIGAAIGLQQYFKPHKDFAASTPDELISADALIRAFTQNEADATARYVSGDVTVEVTGIVRDLQTVGGTTTVTLGSDSTEGSVACTLAPDAEPVHVAKGEVVAVRGQCAGMQGLIEPQVIMIRSAVRRVQ